VFCTANREAVGKEPAARRGQTNVQSRPHAEPNLLWQQLATRVQPKLSVRAPDDPYEREADQVADQVMRMSAPVVQRSCAGDAGGASCANCNDEDELQRGHPTIQRQANSATARRELETPSALLSTLDSGDPLEPATRTFMEPRFGTSFESVRVHTGERAAQSARSIDALAYTIGPHIVFDKGQYAPTPSAGRRLLAHELTHVVQQGNAGIGTRRNSSTGAHPSSLARRSTLSPMLQREVPHGDPIHDPLIAQYRRDRGLPPNGIDPTTGDRVGPSDGEIKYGDDYARWLAKGDVSAPSHAPSLKAVAAPLNVAACGTVTPGMDPSKAATIRGCVTHARYLGFLAQSISNIGQVASPYAPALAQLYGAAMKQFVTAGTGSFPTLGNPQDSTISNVNITISGDVIPVSTFVLRLEQIRTNAPGAIQNGAFSPILGGIALTEDSDSALLSDQADIERTIYHEGIHLLSGIISLANSNARKTPGGKVIHRELDSNLTGAFEARFVKAVEPMFNDALAHVAVNSGGGLTKPTANKLALLQWFRVENEIITRVEEQVYLALRAGRGFTISDLQAMTQLWLATAAYWDPAQHFDNADLSKFLAAKQSTINSDVLPVIQEAQKQYLYLRPPA